MATVKEIVLAERLVAGLEQSGQKVGRDVAAGLKTMIANPNVTTGELQRYISTHIVRAAGAQAGLMSSFLVESLNLPEGEFVKFAAPDFKTVHYGSSDILKNVLQTGSLSHANMAGGVMGEFVLKQVDNTQLLYAPFEKYTIKLSSDACKYCQDGAVKFESDGVFRRHPNCRCIKVKA